MKTERIVFQKDEDLIPAAEKLARGEVVAFPTETVYGLGANALDPDAVKRIFTAKGRPADNPLIVHVAETSDIAPLVRDISPVAQCLIESFMPGPITLVMHKSEQVPDIVTAGLSTVGVRIPENTIARTLIGLAKVPIAAPSANESGSPSPTCASHVMEDMNGKISCVVDGGLCTLGLESTVVDVTGREPVILRPGAVTEEMIEFACAAKDFSCGKVYRRLYVAHDETPRAPGMKYRHYAPCVPVEIILPDKKGHPSAFLSVLEAAVAVHFDRSFGLFCGKETRIFLEKSMPAHELKRLIFYVYGSDLDISAAARKLYAGLRALDQSGVVRIYAAGIQSGQIATAYMNRLEKAAAEDSSLPGCSSSPKERCVLFVCTGNTCRSPMAEAIFNDLVDRAKFYRDAKNPSLSVRLKAGSAGIYASGGSAAEHAISAILKQTGKDIKKHQSRRIDRQMMEEYALILAVSDAHSEKIKELFPDAAKQVFSIFEYLNLKNIPLPPSVAQNKTNDIPDPYGMRIEDYEETARVLNDLISAAFMSILDDLGIERPEFNNKK